jgi:hypothetical protein
MKVYSVIVTIALLFLTLGTRTKLVVRYRLRPMGIGKGISVNIRNEVSRSLESGLVTIPTTLH